jgi:hypothetical protein
MRGAWVRVCCSAELPPHGLTCAPTRARRVKTGGRRGFCTAVCEGGISIATHLPHPHALRIQVHRSIFTTIPRLCQCLHLRGCRGPCPCPSPPSPARPWTSLQESFNVEKKKMEKQVIETWTSTNIVTDERERKKEMQMSRSTTELFPPRNYLPLFFSLFLLLSFFFSFFSSPLYRKKKKLSWAADVCPVAG